MVPFDLASTAYNKNDNWVVRYTGIADVVELGLDVAKTPYAVAAVGAAVIPIKTPPIFDQLLRDELKDVAAILGSGKDGRGNIRRQAKRLFAIFQSVPVLDKALRSVAKLSKDSRSNPAPVVVRVAEGFISAEAASTFGTVFLHTLDKVSPAYSRAAWVAVTVLPTLAAFISAANNFLRFSPAHPWQAVLPLLFGVGFAGAAMLLVSPVGWALSATVSSLLRLKVPAEYRQRGRNWAPLKTACLVTMSASFTGALFGAAGAMNWAPPITIATIPIASYAVAHTSQESGVNRFFLKFLPLRPADAVLAAQSPLDTRREVQRFLIAHGYLRGQADGTLGTRTNAAILKYERHERLSASTPMPALLAHMKADIASSSAQIEPDGQLTPANKMETGPKPAGIARPGALQNIAANNPVPVPKPTYSAVSVPCSQDGTYFGSNVCSNVLLSSTYQREQQAYKAAQSRLGHVDNGVRIEQERWMDTVTRSCRDAQCLTAAFEKRATDLDSRYRGR
nr:peptidoglycan-binding domain-containing protein [Burkholderia sp. 8Y]